VAWTLSFEMMFYLFFLLFYATRFFWPMVGGWAFIVLLNEGLAQSGVLLRPLPLIIFEPLILEFIAGMMAAYFVGRNFRLPWLVPSVIGLGFGVIFAFLPEVHRAFFGVMAIGPAVLGLALYERQVGLSFRHFGLLGASSYAIYLVHNPVQSMVGRLLQQVDSWALTFATCCLVGVIAGLIYHLSYERPALRYLARGHGSNVDTIRNERSY
jgi:peptidoglycan/LPS O-acetylase OafA/YrhL